MSKIRDFATSTFGLPMVLVVAMICLFKLVSSMISWSTKIKFPIPALANASTA